MWAGFESDTYRMQQAGWSIAAEQDITRQTMRLAFRHDGQGMRGFSEISKWDYERNYYEPYRPDLRNDRPIMVQMMGRNINYSIKGSVDWNYVPIDAAPQIAPKTEITSIDDLVHFAPSLVRTKQIIVPEESVEDLMGRILKLQQPEREAEFQRQVQDEGRDIAARPRQKFHGQILSLVA